MFNKSCSPPETIDAAVTVWPSDFSCSTKKKQIADQYRSVVSVNAAGAHHNGKPCNRRFALFVWREFPPPVSHHSMRYDLPRKRER